MSEKIQLQQQLDEITIQLAGDITSGQEAALSAQYDAVQAQLDALNAKK